MSRSRVTLLIALAVAVGAAWWTLPTGSVAPPAAGRADSAAGRSESTAGAGSSAGVGVSGAARHGEADVAVPGSPAVREALPPAPELAVHGVVRRGLVAVPFRKVTLRAWGKSTERETLTDADGAYRFALDPGRYVLEVPLAGELVPRQTTGLEFGPRPRSFEVVESSAAARAIVAVTDEPVQRDLSLPFGQVTVRVFDTATSLGVAGCEVHWQGGATYEVSGRSDGGGVVRFDEVAEGKHRFIARLRGYREASSIVDVTAADPRPWLDLPLEPAGALDVRLLDQDGEPMRISAAVRLSVAPADGGPQARLANAADLRGSTRPLALQYDGLEPGRWRVALVDEQLDGLDERTILFQPVDAPAPVEVEAVPGRVVTADLRVRYRAYVQLFGELLAGGTASGDLRIDWLDPVNGSARAFPAPWQRGSRSGNYHFEGYLAPGVYTLTFTGKDGAGIEREHRETLTVRRENVRRALQLAW